MSGSKGPAATGALIFLCAGSEDLFNEIKENGLTAMGKASHFFGGTVGYGTVSRLFVDSNSMHMKFLILDSDVLILGF